MDNGAPQVASDPSATVALGPEADVKRRLTVTAEYAQVCWMCDPLVATLHYHAKRSPIRTGGEERRRAAATGQSRASGSSALGYGERR